MARKSLPSNAKSHNGYSADEFQRQLLNWFQDRGLLSELQAHLRHQMIVALRGTSLNINSAGSFHQAGSPKLQAINLLVAEFLLRQECHYTLSVFTSEVPLLRNLPEFSSAVHNGSIGGSGGTDDQFPGFHERDVFDILEALGFSPNSEESKRINDLYEHSHGESLLTCLIRSLPGKFRDSVKALNEECESPEPQNKEDLKAVLLNTPLFTEEIQSLILELEIGSQQISQLHNALKRIVEEEVEKVKKEEETRYHKKLIEREHRIQELWKQHDEKIQEKLVRAGEKLKEKQVKFSKELNQKQAHLAVLASQLREQQNEVSSRLNYVQERSDLLEHKEVELKVLKKESEDYLLREQKKLEEKEKQIEQQLLRLDAETQAREQERRELEANRIQIEQASRAIRESQSEIALLRDLQKQHSLSFRAAEERNENKEKQAMLQWSSQGIQVDFSKHKGAIPKKHHVHQQTVQVPHEDQALQTQISGNDMEDVFLHLRAQSTENERQRSQHSMMNNMIDHLEQENSELRGHIAQQRLRIEELTMQASQLMHHLNEVNNSLVRMRNQPVTHETDHGVQTSPLPSASPQTPVMPNRHAGASQSTYGYQPPPPAPPAPPAPPPPQPTAPSAPRSPARGFLRSNQLGAGEESYFSRRLPPDSYIPLYSPSFREHRRKPLRRLMVHTFSSSEESSPSPTEEMLSEARRRLRRLEEETAAVDRNYQEFRLRQVDSLTNTASILFQPVRNEFNSSFQVPGTQNTLNRPLVQNLSATPTSSRSTLLRPQVALLNQFPSTTILQPGVMNTTFLYPSSRLNDQRRQLNNPMQHESSTSVNSLHRLSTERGPVPNSYSWGRPLESTYAPSTQPSKITNSIHNSTRDHRNAMNLPAAFTFNEQSRHLTGERDSTLNNQKSQNALRQQQEPPPCIVSAPHISTAVQESETEVYHPRAVGGQHHDANFVKDSVISSQRITNQQIQPLMHKQQPPSTSRTETSLQFEVIKEVPAKRSLYDKTLKEPLNSAYENFTYQESAQELHPTRDKSPSKDESNSRNNKNEGSSDSKREDDLQEQTKTSSREDVSLKAVATTEENVVSEHSTGESIASFNKENQIETKEQNRQQANSYHSHSSIQESGNTVPEDTTILNERENNSNEIQTTVKSESHVPDPLTKNDSLQPIHTVDSDNVITSDREQLSTTKIEQNEMIADNVDCKTKVSDTSVPLISEPVRKNSISDEISEHNVLQTSPTKPEEQKIDAGSLNDSLKGHSNSPSSPSILGSSNEVSSDVITAGSVGEEKSDDTW